MTKKQMHDFMYDEYVSYMKSHHKNMQYYRETNNEIYLTTANSNASAAAAIFYMAYEMFNENFFDMYIAQL